MSSGLYQTNSGSRTNNYLNNTNSSSRSNRSGNSNFRHFPLSLFTQNQRRWWFSTRYTGNNRFAQYLTQFVNATGNRLIFPRGQTLPQVYSIYRQGLEHNSQRSRNTLDRRMNTFSVTNNTRPYLSGTQGQTLRITNNGRRQINYPTTRNNILSTTSSTKRKFGNLNNKRNTIPRNREGTNTRLSPRHQGQRRRIG